MESFNLKNLVMQFKHIENSESDFHPKGINGMKKSDFILMNQNVSESIFNGIDFDSDGVISDGEYNMALGIAGEDGVLTKEERNNACMQQMTFFARRGIDKWFSIDKNRDGYESELEMRAWQEANCNNQDKVMYLDNVGLEKYYESKDFIHENAQNIEQWLESEIEGLKKDAICMYGVELSESQIIEIKKEQIKQLNTWLLKTGDNATKDAPLYNSANLNTYTRLITRDEIESCCGGDISKPPIGPQDPEAGCAKIFRAMDFTIEDCKYIEEQTEKLNQKFINNEITEEELEKKLAELYIKKNHSTEVKNRLAWAMFDCKSQEEVSQMTSEEYQTYQEEWQKIRNMSANDFRELLKPENEEAKNAFEENSIMTVNQIVQYIDIVESVIGKDNWDNFDWEIDLNQFANIVEKVNGTDKDAELLEGKGRADIPENRQDLLRFLDEKGWLYEQFK